MDALTSFNDDPPTSSTSTRCKSPPSKSKSSSKSSSSKSRKSSVRKIILPSNLRLHKRNLANTFIAWNSETHLWTVSMNNLTKTLTQKETKHSNFPSFHQEEEAKEYVFANAPPKMTPIQKSTNCFHCDSKVHNTQNNPYTLSPQKRHPTNCLNCGVCILNSCSVNWNKAMVPDTFLPTKKYTPSTVTVCKTCDYLATEFRLALLDGDFEYVVKLYMTGNINLRCPLANVEKGDEIMYPIHCAASSGNLQLVRWLIDTRKCPYRELTPLRKGIIHNHTNTNTNTNTSRTILQQLLLTSKGRTILDIALSKNHKQLILYLVKEKKIELSSQNCGHDQEAGWKALTSMLYEQNRRVQTAITSTTIS